jgi:hypothetical protein
MYNKIEIGDSISVQQVPLKAAGQYRDYNLLLSLEGDVPGIGETAKDWSEYDWIYISFSGIVEDEKAVSMLDKTLTERYSGNVRRIEINRDNISVLEGISTYSIVKKFLEEWKKREKETDRETWLKSREIALNKIKSYIMAKK